MAPLLSFNVATEEPTGMTVMASLIKFVGLAEVLRWRVRVKVR